MAKKTTQTTPPIKVVGTLSATKIKNMAKQTSQTTPPVKTTSTKGDKK